MIKALLRALGAGIFLGVPVVDVCAADRWSHPIDIALDAASSSYNSRTARITLVFDVEDPGPARWKAEFMGADKANEKGLPLKPDGPTGPPHNRFRGAVEDPNGCTDNAKARAIPREIHVVFYQDGNEALKADWEEAASPAPKARDKGTAKVPARDVTVRFQVLSVKCTQQGTVPGTFQVPHVAAQFAPGAAEDKTGGSIRLERPLRYQIIDCIPPLSQPDACSAVNELMARLKDIPGSQLSPALREMIDGVQAALRDGRLQDADALARRALETLPR